MFKYLSGDFLSEYQKEIESLKKVQAEIDNEFSARIAALVDREKSRLDSIIESTYKIGDKVRTTSGVSSGTVVGFKTDFTVEAP